MPFTKKEHKEYKKQFVPVDVFKETHAKIKKQAKNEKKSLIIFVDETLKEKIKLIKKLWTK